MYDIGDANVFRKYVNNTSHERDVVLIIYSSITTVQARLGVLLRTIISVTTLPGRTPAAMHEFA